MLIRTRLRLITLSSLGVVILILVSLCWLFLDSRAEKDVLESYNLHANCYITKPIDLEQFLNVVKSIEDFWLSIVVLPPSGAAR